MVKDPFLDPYGPIQTARRGFDAAKKAADDAIKRSRAIQAGNNVIKPAAPTLKFGKPVKRSSAAQPRVEGKGPGDTLSKYGIHRRKRSFLDQ